MLEQAGNDGTEAFEDIGHSKDAIEMRKEYFIGDIVEVCAFRTMIYANIIWIYRSLRDIV